MSRRLLVPLAPLLLVLAVPGCGGGSDVSATDPGASDGTSAPTPTPSPTTTPTPTPTASTTPPSGALQKVRVVGEVVEVGDCVVVRDDSPMTWTITGDLAGDLVLGDRVQVTGAPDLRALGCGGPIVQAVTVTVVPE